MSPAFMPRIRQLTPQVVNKIAAGEVIERPASVVKELLENSVDALATRIEVDIAEGGSERIRIVDDGEGIHAEDLLLAISSHATSKIADADDLFQVQTLGFRGEALASIAEVSRFSIRSRPADQSQGMELEVVGGEFSTPHACGCPAGTQIEVADLFINTPVRRKFLKTVATEFGYISEQFTRIALANPRLHMVLRHNNKLVYELPATDGLLDRISLFFGGDLASKLIRVESELDGVRLWGYAGHPSQSKATRKGQFLFLNGRWITDRSLQHALTEAYRGLLMVGRNPVTFLFLEMPASLVDVNVHPTKSEVRFREGQKLYRQLLAALRNQFLGMELDSQLRVPAGGASRLRPDPDPQQQQLVRDDLVSWAKEQTLRWSLPGGLTHTAGELPPDSEILTEDQPPTRARGWPAAEMPGGTWPAERTGPATEAESATGGAATSDPSWGQPLPEPGAGFDSPDTPFESTAGNTPDRSDSPLPAAAAAAMAAARAGGPEIRAMQIHDAYLVLETTDGLTVIDQHALHERIMYEHLRQRVLNGKVESQRLLLPETVELPAAEAAVIREQSELLTQLGLSVEEFGGNTVLLTGYPVMLRRIDPPQIVRDVAEKLLAAGQSPSRRDLLDSMLHMMSCKAAIKAGQRLTPEEIESLLAQRHLIDDAHHCPHGRPTALVLSRAELDRQFGRLG